MEIASGLCKETTGEMNAASETCRLGTSLWFSVAVLSSQRPTGFN